MRILVTGGAGYIGAHACKSFRQAGYEPVVLDNFSTGHEQFVRWGFSVRGDAGDRDLVSDVIEDYQIDAVVHFAASALVSESVADPELYYSNNSMTTLGLLSGMRKSGCKHLVFSSTCAVYGNSSDPLITEESAKHPVNPYGRTKLMAERMIEDFENAYGLVAIKLRYFNACGADPECEVGEWHNPETHIIPRLIGTAQGTYESLDVYGSDHPTADGTAIRDFVHVSDLAVAHVKAVEYAVSQQIGVAVNLGTGVGISLNQLIARVESISGKKVTVARKPRRIGDPSMLVADPSLAYQLLDFSPRYSDVDSILQSAWRWHENLHNRREEAKVSMAGR